jgi:PhnB protein
MDADTTPEVKVKAIPDNYRRVNPVLMVEGAAAAMDFYAEVFGATERMRIPGPGGVIAHAEIEIGDSVVMVEDASPFMGTQAPPKGGFEGSPNVLFVYVEDVDATMERAAELGAEIKRPASDQFYGDRDGHIVDPFGHHWTVSTHVEDVPADEMARRMEEMMKGAPS